MTFCDKLKDIRKNAGVSLEELGKELGVSARTIVNYENGRTLPPVNMLPKIAKYFDVSIENLMTENEEFFSLAYEQGGNRGLKKAMKLVDEFSGLCAGGMLSPDDIDAVMKAMQDAFWIAKEQSKKYTPKKHRR